MRLWVGVVVWALAWAPGSFAQEANFRHYTVEHGLSQSQVETVTQDQLGYLWVGTHHGLSRFDGRGFDNFTRKDGLLENVVTASLVDRRGRVWVGHPSGGLSRRSGRSFEPMPALKGVEGSEVTSMVEDWAGNVWVATDGAGLLVFPNGEVDEAHRLEEGPTRVHALHRGRRSLWIGAESGLFRIQLGSGTELVRADSERLMGRSIRGLWEDSVERVWVGTADGELLVVEVHGRPAVTPVRGLPRAPIRDVEGDGNGTLWVATDGEGLWSLAEELRDGHARDLRTFSVQEGLSYNQVREISFDREGNPWFAIFGGGISSYMGGQFVTTRHSDNPLVQGVWSVLEDHTGTMWFGTDGGLVRFEPAIPGGSRASSRIYSTENGLCHDVIRALHEDRRGRIWLASKGGGLCQFDPVTGRTIALTMRDGLPTDDLLSITGGDGDELWIGTYEHGIVRYFPPPDGDLRRSRGRFQHYPLTGDPAGTSV